MTFDELVQGLAERQPPLPFGLLRQDPLVALIDLLTGAMDAGDLRPDELEAALELAEAGTLLKSSAYLAERLTAYRAEHFATAA